VGGYQKIMDNATNCRPMIPVFLTVVSVSQLPDWTELTNKITFYAVGAVHGLVHACQLNQCLSFFIISKDFAHSNSYFQQLLYSVSFK